jgi:hypothetical protein
MLAMSLRLTSYRLSRPALVDPQASKACWLQRPIVIHHSLQPRKLVLHAGYGSGTRAVRRSQGFDERGMHQIPASPIQTSLGFLARRLRPTV